MIGDRNRSFGREPWRHVWAALWLCLIPAFAIRADEPLAAQTPSTSSTGSTIEFDRDIRPILTTHCAKCHGDQKQEASLRLDRREVAMRGGENGPAIVPGKSGESLLIQAVLGTSDLVSRMPEKADPLSADQIALLRAWIDQGAIWPEQPAAKVKDPREHWAYRRPQRPELPAVQDAAWSRNPIDRFVLARLEREGLKPAPQADRITLLRRLSFDLIGLPPSVEEVEAFLNDARPDAYERQVERLLASPHYGERWGRHWLDAARYADSDGFEKDKSRQIWNYRDWVIGAFNRDLPYDQFVIHQLAGDLLPNAGQDERVATGFLRNSMINEEGGIDPEQFRMDAMFDRMDCIGKSILGLTIQCCQCHSHKYDPLTQEEYYRMFAFLNNDHESSLVVYSVAEQTKINELVQRMAELEDSLRQASPDWPARLEAWEAGVSNDQPEWHVCRLEHEGENAQRYLEMPDGSLLAGGYAPTQFTATFHTTTPLAKVSAVRLEYLNDPNLPCSGPGRSTRGMCALTEFRLDAGSAERPENLAGVKIAEATADFANAERELDPEFDDRSGKRRVTGPVAFAIDGNGETAWGIDAGPGRRNQPRKAVFVLEKPVELAGGAMLRFHLQQNHGGWNSDDNQNHNLGRFRISVTSADHPQADPLPQRVRQALSTPPAQRTSAQLAAIFSYWRTTVPEFKTYNEQIDALWQQWPPGATSLVLAARDDPRSTAVLKRGDWLKPTKAVEPGVPAALHALPENAPPNRLTFARWLVDRNSPTTARVFVNRLWQQYFGTGIIDTPEDFGVQSNPASHPELLDWLAVELMEGGWSIKAIQRLIVNSATYQQSSRMTPELYGRDQFNRLLARGPRLRVEAEVVRDTALSISGLLDRAIGGPGIFSPAPQSLFMPPNSYGPFNWIEAQGSQRYRRAVYTFRRRSTPYPVLANFDAPNGDFACVRRTRANTPLQALTTLNETVFMECSRALALKTLAEGGSEDADRIGYAFRRVLSRPPTAAERQELLVLLQKQLRRIGEGWVNPAEIATGKNELPPQLPPATTPAQLAAYTVVSRVLLNLDEAITKE